MTTETQTALDISNLSTAIGPIIDRLVAKREAWAADELRHAVLTACEVLRPNSVQAELLAAEYMKPLSVPTRKGRKK